MVFEPSETVSRGILDHLRYCDLGTKINLLWGAMR